MTDQPGAGMTADEWLDRRAQMAAAFGCEPSEVAPEAVWYLVWPDPPITDEIRATARGIAERLGLAPLEATYGEQPNRVAELLTNLEEAVTAAKAAKEARGA